MSRGRAAACALGLAVAVGFAGQAGAWNAEAPDEPAAQEAARAALVALGPERGARTLVADVRTIAGLGAGLAGGGLALKAQVEDLQRNLHDLGAQVSELEIRVELPADILFEFDKADIRPPAEATLTKLAQVIRAKRTGDVRIDGHTDGKGNDAYNQALSERRAESVKRWLATKGGTPPDVMKTRGFGKTKPVAPNARPDGSDDPEGRARNRRVEVVIQTTERARR